MTVFCVGDIHGCFTEFSELLDSVRFNPKEDLLLTTGDIIGRGPKPLETLRFFMNYRNETITVLGNHELSLLRNYCLWKDLKSDHEKEKFLKTLKSPELRLIMNEPDGEEIISYLRSRPLCYYDQTRKLFLSHAGLSPEWTIDMAVSCAREVENVLQSPRFTYFALNIFSDKPSRWNKVMKKNNETLNEGTGSDQSYTIPECDMRRYIYTVNTFTRMRFCKPNLSLDFQCKDTPEVAARSSNLIPWYQLSTELKSDETIIFGHWAALNGESGRNNIIALDTGCVWNGALTLIDVDHPTIRHINRSHH